MATGDTRHESTTAVIERPSSRTTFLVLVGISLAFFAASVGFVATDEEHHVLERLFTGYEANLPTWFSAALWLGASALALTAGAAGRRLGDPAGGRWTLLGAIFALLSLDETGQLHEETVGPLMDTVGDVFGLSGDAARLLAVGIAGLGLLAVSAWCLPWYLGLSAWLRRRLLAAAGIFVTGSFVLEVVSRMSDSEPAAYLSPIEELMEMIGITILVVTLMPVVREIRAASQPTP